MTIDIYNPYTIRIIGGVVVGLLLILIRYGITHMRDYLVKVKKRKKQKPVTQEQDVKKDQEYQKIDSVIDTYITPANILKRLQKLPPLQRESIANSYKGIKVSWKVKYRGIKPVSSESTYTVMFIASSQTHVSCLINLEEYPKLKVIREGCPVIVQGVIESVGYEDRNIHLTFCKLKI